MDQLFESTGSILTKVFQKKRSRVKLTGYIDTAIWNMDATWAHSGAASALLVAGCAQAAVKPRGLSDRGPLISFVLYCRAILYIQKLRHVCPRVAGITSSLCGSAFRHERLPSLLAKCRPLAPSLAEPWLRRLQSAEPWPLIWRQSAEVAGDQGPSSLSALQCTG